MKAEELMLGDYVQNTAGIIGKVVGIKPTEITMQYHDNSTCFSDPKLLEPIPLTPEILGKNGAIITNLYGEQQHFTYWLHGFRMLAIYDADFSYQINGGARKIKYVHQLQHALKLCGIEKSIEI